MSLQTFPLSVCTFFNVIASTTDAQIAKYKKIADILYYIGWTEVVIVGLIMLAILRVIYVDKA